MYVGAQGGQNNMADPMELELQPFVACLMDVETKLEFSGRVASALSWAIYIIRPGGGGTCL